jgi:phenylalanyl-tRNA synthetase beta subunit
LTIKNLNTLIPSKWLKQKLITSSIIPKNNLIDFQNYILLETGYPFEFYDLDKINSKLNTSQFNFNLTCGKNIEILLVSNEGYYKSKIQF